MYEVENNKKQCVDSLFGCSIMIAWLAIDLYSVSCVHKREAIFFGLLIARELNHSMSAWMLLYCYRTVDTTLLLSYSRQSILPVCMPVWSVARVRVQLSRTHGPQRMMMTEMTAHHRQASKHPNYPLLNPHLLTLSAYLACLLKQ